MNSAEIFQFHERQYFHELQARENLIARLQFSLGLLTALLGSFAFIFYRIDFAKDQGPATYAFLLVSAAAGACFAVCACAYFVRAAYSRYEMLPTTASIAAYHDQLVRTYESFPDGSSTAAMYFEQFLLDDLIKCSTHNARHNAERYEYLHQSTAFVIYSVPCLAVGFVAFVLGGIEKAS